MALMACMSDDYLYNVVTVVIMYAVNQEHRLSYNTRLNTATVEVLEAAMQSMINAISSIWPCNTNASRDDYTVAGVETNRIAVRSIKSHSMFTHTFYISILISTFAHHKDS
jgi:hypothetical protein